jgi:hypothetical protein
MWHRRGCGHRRASGRANGAIVALGSNQHARLRVTIKVGGVPRGLGHTTHPDAGLAGWGAGLGVVEVGRWVRAARECAG